MILRTDEEKADIVKTWHRPDRSFFAAGACHILAHAFLEESLDSKFHAIYIMPQPGFRGSHVVVSNGETVFDYHGYSRHNHFFDRYFRKLRARFPDWNGTLIDIHDSLVSQEFCGRYNHRMPHQFLHDPILRARHFLRKISAPV